jgi:hypothetical protein
MPHLNRRRGDTRRRVQKDYEGRGQVAYMGNWHRIANRKLRNAVSQVLQELRATGYACDSVAEVDFPLAREADDIWNYD